MFLQPDRFEPDTVSWIAELPAGDVTLWDVGAHVGVFSLYAALRPDVRVLAFEPKAASYWTLNENIELNGMAQRVSAYPVALCAETKIDVLNMASTSIGGSFHGFGVETDQFGRGIKTEFHQGAVGFSIDDFARLFSPPLPTHVKIDVDGLEPDILRGGLRTLSAPTVRSIIVEVEGSDARSREIVGLMNDLGFSPRPKGSAAYRNVIFDRQHRPVG